MRGNVGYDESALGRVRLGVGQGLTGLAIADRRPISVAHAPSHDLFFGFPELHEERYPIFAVAPVMGERGPVGGLVVQRAKRPFSESEIELLMALSATVFSALRSAEMLDALWAQGPTTGRQVAGVSPRVLLTGRPVTAGRALGVVAMARRPVRRRATSSSAEGPRNLRRALRSARRALEGFRHGAIGPVAALLDSYLLLLSDSRFAERSLELIEAGADPASALGQVSREAARAAVRLSGDPFLKDRVRDLEDLCDALAVLSTAEGRERVPSNAILVGDQLSLYELLLCARRPPAGIALCGIESDDRSVTLLGLLDRPSVVDVKGLLRRASPGDIALLDATHGYLEVNPSRLEVAEFRAWRRASRLC
jgi:phosphotransferase system enzyme I (PtsP)